MNLKTYIETLGDDAAAKLFGVKSRTVQSWRRGERSPRPEQARKIVKKSGGKLSLEAVYGK